MNIVAVIQARTDSKRLPAKVLIDLVGEPVICRVVDRARRIKGLTDVLVATSDTPDDDELASLCEARVIPVFRGSKEDVLDRYVMAGRKAQADAVVRLTGDCPLLDPRESDRVVEAFREGGVDLVSNSHPPSYPDGLDTTIVSLSALEKAGKLAKRSSEREHVVPYFYDHSKEFRSMNIRCDQDLSFHRWTLDAEDDLRLIREIYTRLLKKGQFGYLNEILDLFEEDPQLGGINKGHERNEGYQQSLAEEQSYE